MTAKFIEYGSTEHDKLEIAFDNGEFTLYDAYSNPSTAKRKAYEKCLSEAWDLQSQIMLAVGKTVVCEHRIKSHNTSIFTFIAKYEVYNERGSGFIIYNIWCPTRQERFTVIID